MGEAPRTHGPAHPKCTGLEVGVSSIGKPGGARPACSLPPSAPTGPWGSSLPPFHQNASSWLWSMTVSPFTKMEEIALSTSVMQLYLIGDEYSVTIQCRSHKSSSLPAFSTYIEHKLRKVPFLSNASHEILKNEVFSSPNIPTTSLLWLQLYFSIQLELASCFWDFCFCQAEGAYMTSPQ